MPYPIKGFCEISQDMVQILLMLEILFIQNSRIEGLFCGAPSSSEPSLFFQQISFGLGMTIQRMTILQPIQNDFHRDFE